MRAGGRPSLRRCSLKKDRVRCHELTGSIPAAPTTFSAKLTAKQIVPAVNNLPTFDGYPLGASKRSGPSRDGNPELRPNPHMR